MTLGEIGSHLSGDRLLLFVVYTGLAAPQASGNSPASNSHLNIRALG